MTDPTPRDTILHHRTQIVQILTDAGCTEPRLTGWAAANRPMPTSVPLEIWVTLPGRHDWRPQDLARLDEQLSDLVGQPILISHVPPQAMNILPGERVLYL